MSQQKAKSSEPYRIEDTVCVFRPKVITNPTFPDCIVIGDGAKATPASLPRVNADAVL